MAKLYFRYGAMNSGKSTALLQVAHNYEERGMHVLIVKPQVDTKIVDSVHTRMGLSRTADIVADAELDIRATVKQWSKDVEKINCVLVDEAQFLASNQIDQLLELTVKDNIPVIAYGLRNDFLTKAFPASQRLFELAHTIEELKTICRCGKKALFSARKIDGNFVFGGNQVAIDGENKVEYESLCANCYFDFRGAS